MRLTVENIEEWKELLNRAALDKMDIENFSETQTDAEWLDEWSGFHYGDAIAEEMSCWNR
jgi:hypothetical protein